jgi:hypothetical protein
MDDLYVIGKDDPFQSVNNAETTQDEACLAVFHESLMLDLDEPDGKKRVEHRYHQRFQIKEDAFALIRSISTGPLDIQGKSLGCIACAVFNARPARLGKIDNISMGGLVFQHVAGKTQLNETFVLDILLAGCRFYLADMHFEIKADIALPEDIPGRSFEMRRVRLQFQKLSANQQARLAEFLFNHGVEIVGIGSNV